MKSNYLIIKEKKLIIETYSGIVTLENAQKHKIEMAKDPDFSTDFGVISDISKAILDMPVSFMPDITTDTFLQNKNSVALVHKANQSVYERIFNRLRAMFPPNHIYSINIEDLLLWLGLVDFRAEIESSLFKLHENPQFNWA